jgi:hypothetical protein
MNANAPATTRRDPPAPFAGPPRGPGPRPPRTDLDVARERILRRARWAATTLEVLRTVLENA